MLVRCGTSHRLPPAHFSGGLGIKRDSNCSATAATYTSSDTLALLREIIDQHVFAEMIGAGEQRAPSIDLRHLVHERAQTRRIVEHERVDRDPLARYPLHFLQ